MANPLASMAGGKGGSNYSDITGALGDVFGTGKSESSSGTTGVTGENKKFMDELTALFSGNVTSGKYSKEAAIADTAGPLQDLIRTMLQKEMPSIQGANKSSGAYGQTTTKLLENDLQSRISTGALGLILQNIKDYADIQTQQGTVAAGTAKTSGVTTSQETSTQTDGLLKTIGGGFGKATGLWS